VKVPECPEGMVWIPGGTFRMGSEDGDDDEKPVHPVTVAGFCLDRTEVTVAAYAACVKQGKCSDADLKGISCNYQVDGKGAHPMNCVDWTQADAYCKGAGNRLPAEEEWEYAARGGDAQRTYPWGDEPPGNQACWDGEGNDLGKGNRESTCEVGKYPRGDSRWGVHDLAGNVWEWTSSRYCPYPKEGVNACTDGLRVLRGASWNIVGASYLRAASRYGSAPANRVGSVGFRCAKTAR
jgi:formylglycine-generating enzyme required for sulfatase activity